MGGMTIEGFAEAVEKWKRKVEALGPAIAEATERNCQGLVGEIKKNIVNEAIPWAPLHPYTVLRRLAAESPKRRDQLIEALKSGAHAKALINHGDLLRSITYSLSEDKMSGAVGVNRTVKSADGKYMINIAAVLFKGKTIAVTPKMRLYLASTGLPLKKSTTHISIPPRDPITPTYNQYKTVMKNRYKEAVSKAMKTGG